MVMLMLYISFYINTKVTDYYVYVSVYLCALNTAKNAANLYARTVR
jgi:hypothetical protein